MKLKKAEEAYYYHTETASSVNRQLGFAGIAIIWIFAKHVEGVITMPFALYLPAAFIILALGCDLLQ